MAKVNKTSMDSDITQFQPDQQDTVTTKTSTKQEFLGNKENLRNLLCMVAIFIANSFCYYVLGYQLKYIRGDIYVNNIVNSFSELVAFAISGAVTQALGIKWAFNISYMISLAGIGGLVFT